MVDYQFDVKERSDFGKGFARRIRVSGNVPAVIYGSGKPAIHITLPTHDLTQAVRVPNALFEITVNGTKHLALVKDIQRNFVHRNIEHVDLLEVKAGQIVTVPVELKVTGEPKPGTQISVSLKTLHINVDATQIPRIVEVDINNADAGDHFTVADVKLPTGASAVLKLDHVLVAVKARAKKKEVQVDVAGGGPEETEEKTEQ